VVPRFSWHASECLSEIAGSRRADPGKIGIFPAREIFEASSKVSYFKGEEDVAARWPGLDPKGPRRE
jgi:hypothetical protein